MSRPTLVIGDVHGCAEELRQLVGQADVRCGEPVDVVLVGDLFTKGPDPVGVWRLIQQRSMRAVLGNHDTRLLDVVAGKRPHDAHGHACVAALDGADPDWLDWLSALPLWCDVGRYRVTHAALHPSGDPALTDRETHLVRRTWSADRDGPRWWTVYEGPPVIFGHDAAQGLVWIERDQAPWIVGLDSGCVYGGQLSGLLTDSGERIQVPAARTYRAVGA